MNNMSKRYKDLGSGVTEFQLCIKMGGAINDEFDLAEAVQKVVDGLERGKKTGSVTDEAGIKVGEFGFV